MLNAYFTKNDYINAVLSHTNNSVLISITLTRYNQFHLTLTMTDESSKI